MTDTVKIDKSTWGDGPWQSEPDRKEWTDAATGLPCLAIRSEFSGSWCGYVAVPPGHRAHGGHYDAVDVSVHGGLTYSDECNGRICHAPKEGEPDNVWWLGFDCCHAFDLAPAMRARMREYAKKSAVLGAVFREDQADRNEVYRDLPYVEGECVSLAKQLAELT